MPICSGCSIFLCNLHIFEAWKNTTAKTVTPLIKQAQQILKFCMVTLTLTLPWFAI